MFNCEISGCTCVALLRGKRLFFALLSARRVAHGSAWWLLRWLQPGRGGLQRDPDGALDRFGGNRDRQTGGAVMFFVARGGVLEAKLSWPSVRFLTLLVLHIGIPIVRIQLAGARGGSVQLIFGDIFPKGAHESHPAQALLQLGLGLS